MNKNTFLYTLLSLANVFSLFGGEITTTVNRKEMALNESFTVTFSSKESVVPQPDFAPLEKDFSILSSGQSQNISIINGAMTKEISWNLVLIPKRDGEIILPSIAFGSLHSQEIKLQVSASSTPKNNETLFVETELRPSGSVYQQAQLLYIIRLFTAQKIAQAGLTEVKTNDPDLLIERLGNDSEYEYLHPNGRRYLVFERKYLLFPQHAGELIIDPLTFEAKIITGGHSLFNVQTEILRTHSEGMKIDVKPIPPPFTSSRWLPATDLKWSEEWSSDPEKMTIGEPITWTLTLKAEGCKGDQIPSINFNFPNEIKSYLDKTESTNQVTLEGFSCVKQLKVALIASNKGTFTLPEIAIDWWNLNSDQAQQTKIPARTLQVHDEAIALNEEEVAQKVSSPENIKNGKKSALQLPTLVWTLIGISLFFSIAVFIFLCFKRKKEKKKTPSLNQLKEKLKEACAANKAKATEAALLACVGELYPNLKPLTIKAMREKFSEELQTAVDELQQALYGQKSEWSGERLWKAFEEFKPTENGEESPKNKHKRELLERLYPD